MRAIDEHIPRLYGLFITPGHSSWNVRGPVETLRTESAEWDLATETWKAPWGFSMIRFRPDGKISETEYHNPDGSISRTLKLYDEAGRIRESRSHSNKTITGKQIWFYDDSGRPVRLVDVDRKGVERESELYRYDANGHQTKIVFLPKLEPNTGIDYSGFAETSYAAPGAATVTTVCDEVLFHDVNHRLLQRLVITRDAEGRVVKEEMRLAGQIPFPGMPKELENASPEAHQAAVHAFQKLFGPDKPMMSTTYAYDQKGRRIERHMRMGDLGGHRTTFRYDDRDNAIEETTVDTTREMQIDNEGNLRSAKETSHIQLARFEYKYDAQGNWTERVVWSRLEPNPNYQRSNVERRQFTYHP